MERQKATELLRAFWSSRPTPVDPFEISRALGLEVKPLHLVVTDRITHSGSQEAGVICYNPDNTHRHQRFEIAHGLGHHVLGHSSRLHGPCAAVSLYSYNPLEASANKFAAELLMPVYSVSTLIDHHNIVSVEKLADAFDVSGRAVLYRLRALGYVQ